MPKIVDKAEKKQLILEASIAEFAEKGVSKTKIVDIAKRANIGKGTVYEYFSSKEAIFMEAMDFFMKSMSATIEKELNGLTDPKERIIAIIDALVINAESFQDLLVIILDFWAFGFRGEQISKWREAYQMFQEMISEIIDDGIEKGIFRDINKQYFSSILIGLLDGIVFQIILFNKEYDIKAARDAAVDTILHGILK